MSSQSTKERKENLTVLHNSPTHDTFDAKCVKQYIEKKSRSKSKDYYKPIKTNSAFNGNYIEYKSNGGKDKIYHQENTLI